MGSRIIVEPGLVVQVPGQLIAEVRDSVQPSFEIEGKLQVRGDWKTGLLLAPLLVRGEGLVELNGATQQEVRGLTQTHFQHLSLNNPGGLQLGRDLHIAGHLYLHQGKIWSESYILTLDLAEEDAIIGANADRYLIGTLNRQLGAGTYLFPLGTETSWQPVWIHRPAQSAGSWLHLRYVEETPAGVPPAEYEGQMIEGFWGGGHWYGLGPFGEVEPYEMEVNWYGNGSLSLDSLSLIALQEQQGQWVAPPQDSLKVLALGNGGYHLQGFASNQWGSWSLGMLGPLSTEKANAWDADRIWLTENAETHWEIGVETTQSGWLKIEVWDLQGKNWGEEVRWVEPGIRSLKINRPFVLPQMTLLKIQLHGKLTVLKSPQ